MGTKNELYIGQATSDSGCCLHRKSVCGNLDVIELTANASAICSGCCSNKTQFGCQSARVLPCLLDGSVNGAVIYAR